MAKLASTCTIWVLIVRVNFPGECSRLFVLSFLMTLLLGSERGGSEWRWETNIFKKHPRYFWCFPPLFHSQPLVTGTKNNPETFHSIFSAMRVSVRNCLCNKYDDSLVRYFLLISFWLSHKTATLAMFHIWVLWYVTTSHTCLLTPSTVTSETEKLNI